ncbi:MAG: S1C family serine protease [Anaerolineales bacterium]
MRLSILLALALVGSTACSLLSGGGSPPTQVVTLPEFSTPTLTPPPPATPAASPTVAPVALPTLALPTSTPIVISDDEIYAEIYRRINPAVVSILIHDSFGQPAGQGTGFVIDAAGHIVTNQHVVAEAVSIEVTFPSGDKVWAQLRGTDAAADLAVVQVPSLPPGVAPVVLADSDQVAVGQRVIAIGNPFGFEGTITAGIVSGLGRVLQSEAVAPGGGSFSAPDVIQTDAAINPGNSGGPLINMDGQVIGVNKAIFSETGVNSGVGFAIASNTVQRIVPSLIANGSYSYPYLGLTSRSDLTLAEIEALGLPSAAGVYVISTVAGGPADQAGLRGGGADASGLPTGGDFIVAIDGLRVRDFSEMLSYLVNHTDVGQVVAVTVVRDGEQMDIPVTLGARP